MRELTLSREGANKCFACGQENPIGLKLGFRCQEGRAETEFIPGELYQGWPGIVHGGILYTLLDEAMGYAVYPLGVNCVTATSEVRFKTPAPVGELLLITARVTRKRKRLIEARASITLKDGTTVAECKALMYVISEEPDAKNPGSY